MNKILLTGITGLVGSAFVVDLYRRNKDMEIVAFTRGRMNESADKRVNDVIREQCQFDGCPEIADEVLKRVKVIEYDTTLSSSQLPFDKLKGIDAVFHCAADVNLGKDINGATYNCNFGGTQRMLKVAKKLGVKEFHYVSTAYVAGKQSGVIMEGEAKENIHFNNAYEKSKYESERLVRESGLPFNIYRPSIIVGRLSDGDIRKPLAFYRLCEFIAKIKKRQCAKLGMNPSDPIFIPVRLEAKMSQNVYFVPIDYVQRTITRLFLKGCKGKTYHVTGRGPASVENIEKVTCSILGIEGLTVVEKIKHPTSPERLMHKYIGDLLPYFSSEMIFDVSNVIEELGEDDLNWKLDYNGLMTIINKYYEMKFPEAITK